MTKNGKIILDLIETEKCHPTAEELHKMALDSGHRMSVATVYNNLTSLCSEGLIKRLSSPDEPDRYDCMMRHDHLICKKCGRITDLFLSDITTVLSKEAGIPFDSYDLRLMHVCDTCKAVNA